jgi:hypothetical protein
VAPVTGTARWARTTRQFSRYAVWAVPGYAVLAGVGALYRNPGFSASAARLARYHATHRTSLTWLCFTAGAAFVGLVALVALTALLAGVRGRRVTATGLLFGLAGAAVLLVEVGTLVVRQPGARSALLHGHWTRATINADVRGGSGALLVILGAVALSVGWMLLGAAVWRSEVLARSDGVLVMISAPMIFLGGFVLDMLPVIGAMLLLAAGIGLGWTAARMTPGGAGRH